LNNKTVIGLLCGLGAASIWGGMYVVSKVVLEIIPPFALVSLRLLLGALTLVIVLLIHGVPKISHKQFLQVLGVGFVGYGISLSLQFLGTKLSTAGNGSLVTSATPAFVLVFAWLLLKETITPRRLIALILATLGVIAVIDRSVQRSEYRIYNLGCLTTTSLADLVAQIERALGKKASLERVSDQPGDVPFTYASIERAREELGYDPQTPVSEGIPKFVDWFRRRRNAR